MRWVTYFLSLAVVEGLYTQDIRKNHVKMKIKGNDTGIWKSYL